MAKHITSWRPDTCNCEIQYEWDDTQPQNEREHKIISHSRKCDAHSRHLPHEAFGKILDENTRKNLLLSDISEKLPEIFEDTKSKRFKEGHGYSWGFDSERRLLVHLPNLTDKQQAKITEIINPDKVVLGREPLNGKFPIL